jgi:hypothetical protein
MTPLHHMRDTRRARFHGPAVVAALRSGLAS